MTKSQRRNARRAQEMRQFVTHRAHREFLQAEATRNRGRPRRLTQAKGWSSYKVAAMRRAKTLNQEDYAEYLQSAHWRTFRTLFFRSPNTPKTCVVCDAVEVELHHRTYERLGAEYFTDVIPLCRGHHALAHDRERAGAPLSTAHLAL